MWNDSQAPQLVLGDRAEDADQHRRDAENDHQLGAGSAHRFEHRGEDAQQGVHAHLRRDAAEHGRDGRRRRGIAVGQPEGERDERRLGREHHEQGRHRDVQQPGIRRTERRHLAGKVGEVERAGEPVERADAEEEQRRAEQVQHHELDAAAQLAGRRAEGQQAVRRDQEHLEEDEEVEQVTGEEGAVQPHQQELEQREERQGGEPALGLRGLVRQHREPRDGGEQQHDDAQPVDHEHDAERRGPVPEAVHQDRCRPRPSGRASAPPRAGRAARAGSPPAARGACPRAPGGSPPSAAARRPAPPATQPSVTSRSTSSVRARW
jgi:hypothetical protein